MNRGPQAGPGAQPGEWRGGVGLPGGSRKRCGRRRRLEGGQDAPAVTTGLAAARRLRVHGPRRVGKGHSPSARDTARRRGTRPAPGERERPGAERKACGGAHGRRACRRPSVLAGVRSRGASGVAPQLASRETRWGAGGRWALGGRAEPVVTVFRPDLARAPRRVTDSRADRRGDTNSTEEASSTRLGSVRRGREAVRSVSGRRGGRRGPTRQRASRRGFRMEGRELGRLLPSQLCHSFSM